MAIFDGNDKQRRPGDGLAKQATTVKKQRQQQQQATEKLIVWRALIKISVAI